MIPAMIPERSGAPEASAMPRHKGSATRKTTNPEGRSREAVAKESHAPGVVRVLEGDSMGKLKKHVS
jgi:hypothetical protein